MKEYYKISYTIRGDTSNIRSVIFSCINEGVAMANFEVAFIGLSPSIVSIKWVPKPGSLVGSVPTSTVKAATAEPVLTVIKGLRAGIRAEERGHPPTVT